MIVVAERGSRTRYPVAYETRMICISVPLARKCPMLDSNQRHTSLEFALLPLK